MVSQAKGGLRKGNEISFGDFPMSGPGARSFKNALDTIITRTIVPLSCACTEVSPGVGA